MKNGKRSLTPMCHRICYCPASPPTRKEIVTMQTESGKDITVEIDWGGTPETWEKQYLMKHSDAFKLVYFKHESFWDKVKKFFC
jgi:hypothetical protein